MKKKAKTAVPHKIKALRVWLIILSALLAFLFIVTMVLTQVPFLTNTINSVTGGSRRYLKRGDPSKYQYFVSDYKTKEEVYNAANELNKQIVQEGAILLKNEKNALPLKEGAKISVFGRNSVDAVLGGSGSNKGDTSSAITDFNDALKASGFDCNPVLADYYRGLSGYQRPSVTMGTVLTGYPVCEATLPYNQSVRDSYSKYGDAAVVVISREGGEGFDLPRTMFWNGGDYKSWGAKTRQTVPGARSIDDHYLQLDANETAMLKEACDNFEKVVVVINSASPIELGFLDDTAHYAYNEHITGAIWLGHPGAKGLAGLGELLNGKVNFSGKTIDTFSRNFKNDPAWYNFGNYNENDGNRYTTDGNGRGAYFVEYREGIYVGYRYYETMAEEKNRQSEGTGENWYKQNVVYPFGYGLSYSTFDWVVKAPSNNGATLDASTEISIDVTVTNTGSRAGKDVIQLYYTAPYNEGGIEKPHVVLGDFIKTDLLEGGESKTYTLKLRARDMASYDWNDANKNNFKGYELESGKYTLSIMKNAHTPIATCNYYVAEGGIKYEYSEINSEVKVENLFDEAGEYIPEYLSRKNAFSNFNVLAGASAASRREVSAEFILRCNYSLNDTPDDPWYSQTSPEQSKKQTSYNDTSIKLYELLGKAYDDPMWEIFMNQLTVSQLVALISVGNYRTVAVENIGKPETIDFDGPMGFASFMGDGAVYGTCYYASECILAATWNTELAEAFGEMVGNESIVGDEDGDGRTYSGWYAPAMNIHRSQFGGRNFEYFSEDGLISGKMAKSVVLGAKSKGVYTYAKHFALNEQETCRDSNGILTWANEQAMRELYFKPFEICVKEGNTTALMSSFNRIGYEWAGGSYNLLTRLLRDEWGFKGTVITDFNLKSYMNVDQMLRAGGDLNLSPKKLPSSTTTSTDITVLRKAAKNILYTVANSNAMNGSGEGIEWGYALPWWIVWLIVAVCTVFAICAAVGTVLFFQTKKYKSELKSYTTTEVKNEN